MGALLIIIALVLLYFLPAIVAQQRGHHNTGAILLLNVLLGWTVLGWIVALVWSATAVSLPRPEGR